MNECGSCTACCTTFEIPEIEKKAGVPCTNLCTQGCAIHETRPATCEKYFCVWRDPKAQALHMPEWACPSQTGLIINAMGTDLSAHRVVAFETYEGASRQYWGDRLVTWLARKRFLVAVQWRDKIVRLEAPGR